MRDEKEERKKQARSNKQTRQSNTAHPRQSLFLEKMRHVQVESTHKTLKVYRLEEKTEGYFYSIRVCSYVYREKGQDIIIIINNTSALGLVSRASRIFPRMRMRVRKCAGEGKEKYVRAHVAPAQDPETTNQITATRKLHVN